VWSSAQFESHLEAAKVLEIAVSKAWKWIASAIREGKSLTELDVQRFIVEEFARHDCTSDYPPMCAVNAHSADPHFELDKSSSSVIKAGDFILIDLWCKKKSPDAVYADITRVGVAASGPAKKQQEIFNIVKSGRDAAMKLITDHLTVGKTLQGWEVDRVCRDTIAAAGYGHFFTHRTGHNLGERVHGAGANIDDFETKELRQLLPGTCFTIEPGVYLPGEFGVRLEHDVYLSPDGKSARITNDLQDHIVCLY
jgi:Xaa-Pro aminopeptidase